ncbi:MAG: FAD-dependent oxidoreductase [Acidimicrobiia bacterium]|nr:FAD-dependent oxidoreductase [Acidimicrobiia bacterium]
MNSESPPQFLVIGGGPAGSAAATTAASQGRAVTVVEKDIVGGGAHLWDCIPSKTMSASAIRMDSIRHASRLGLKTEPSAVDMTGLSTRMAAITADINQGLVDLLDSQNVDLLSGTARLTGPHSALVKLKDGGETQLRFDHCLLSTGSAPRVPEWASVDGERILTTRHAYDLPEVPDHMVVIGSGVTGVEFVHIFAALGSEVTLVVSRQQVLPYRDPEVAATLEEDFIERGIQMVIGARASSVERENGGVVVRCDDGRVVEGSHALLAIGSVPLTADLGLDDAGVTHEDGFITVDEYQRTSVPHIYAAGDCTGQMPLSSVAAMQGRKIGRHISGMTVTPLDYSKVSQAVFTQPEIASVGLEEVDAAAHGRKVRTTKVPFAANARSVLQGSTRGFVKVISDPATGVVLGGTIVGHRASELIGIVALAVSANVNIRQLVETLMVHPSAAEAITEAAE